MAGTLSTDELRRTLRSATAVTDSAFAVLKSISALINDKKQEVTGREMVLRALERRNEFGHCTPILDGLTRAIGLFPYADPEALDFRDSVAYEFHRPLNMSENLVFHREQADVYRRLLDGDSVILSAPTSFGKSRIIDAMIATRRFKNIAVIVPTLALIDETRRRLSRQFSGAYKIVTHLSQEPAEKNIFVFTAERAVAYEAFPRIEFFVIDEFYKLGAMSEDTTRTVALNHAFYKLRQGDGQFYLLGPSIETIPHGLEEEFRCYFYPTRYNTVVADQERVAGRGHDLERLVTLAKTLNEPTLVYCKSPARVNAAARALLAAGVGVDTPSLKPAAEWTGSSYHPDWVFGQALVRGIGVHHGRLPRSLAQYVVRMFNELRLRFLICTSTLIEGVNTKAKNVVVFDKKIGTKDYDFFTFNNIRGRSGRMFEHYVGRVFLFHEPPEHRLPFVEFPVFTQGEDVPGSLLVQIDTPDLRPAALDRVRKIADQEVLPMSIIRENSTIDPEAQIGLAKAIGDDAHVMSRRLSWRKFPEYQQLKAACELIWKHLVDAKRRGGVRSGSQLAMKTWQLRKTPSAAKRIRDELTPGKYAAKSPDEAVERVLAFERTWAGFEMPRYLMALSRIQASVLGRQGLPTGDYSAFAAQVECSFRNPVTAALDEYGVPPQVVERIQPALGETDDLDRALVRLKTLDVQALRLGNFEAELVRDAQAGL